MTDEQKEEVLTRLHKLLVELYFPAGVLIYVSAPHKMLDGRSVAEAIQEGDLEGLNRVADSLDAMATGAFL